MKAWQIPLFNEKKYPFRKVVRPIGIRETNHVVLKAVHPVLRKNHKKVKDLVRETQRRFGIRIYALAIMEDHLHFLIATPTRTAFQNSLRFLAGQLALKIRRGKLWLKRAWSRIVRWGRDYQGTADYIKANPVKAGCFDEVDAMRIVRGVLRP